MAKSKKTHAELQKDLLGFVTKTCPGVDVEVTHSDRWDRTCFTFRWPGFAGLLLEERFRLVAHLVPPDYFAAHCSQAVWLELEPAETIDEYLAQPRSEDIDGKVPAIWKMLKEKNFFGVLEDELVRIPMHQCPNDFTYTKRLLEVSGLNADQKRDALLAFMRHEAYTDWEVLRKVRPIAEKKQKVKK